MAHKTLIGGTAYEVSGGKTLIGGTAYSIKNGKTLVGGTVYEVAFAENVMVVIARGYYEPNSEVSRVTINGVVYDGSEVCEIPVEVGTFIECYVKAGSSNSYISVNDVKVIENTTGTYTYTATTNCTITIMVFYNPFGYYEGRIVITEN